MDGRRDPPSNTGLTRRSSWRPQAQRPCPLSARDNQMVAIRVDVLVISGSMGAGKTAVVAEASDLLIVAGCVHAAVDLDWLCAGHLPAGISEPDLMYANLRATWDGYAAAGARRLLI